MKCPGLVVVILSAALLSSCSWAKHRYQRLRTSFHRPAAAKQLKGPGLVSIQPTRAQQKEAQRLLAGLHTEDDELQEDAPEGGETSPQDTENAPSAAAPFRAAPLTLPSGTGSAYLPAPDDPLSYTDRRFTPRDAPITGAQQEEISAPVPQETDAASLRGLRSPSLPTTLPMDIDGKLHSPTTP